MRNQAAIAIGLAMSSFVALAADAPILLVGSQAPELKLAAADGSSRSLAAADNSTLLIFYRGLW